VQFSQLPCSDVVTRTANTSVGPRRSPLGLSADPGGFPLYKNGVLVGGIGVVGDNDYGFDKNILDVEDDAEEAIAIAGTTGFDAPARAAGRPDHSGRHGAALHRRHRRFAADGPVQRAGLRQPAGRHGQLTAVRGYYDGRWRLQGVAYGTEARACDWPPRRVLDPQFDGAGPRLGREPLPDPRRPPTAPTASPRSPPPRCARCWKRPSPS
jgi:hypothetical protein